MPEKDFKEFVKKARERYRKIGSVPCPTFGGERVYFTRAGFKHLIRKGRLPRLKEEQIKRLKLMPQGPVLLAKNTKFSTYTAHPNVSFWSFIGTKNKKKVTVIVRQFNAKPKHFFSIFEDRPSKSTQTP